MKIHLSDVQQELIELHTKAWPDFRIVEIRPRAICSVCPYMGGADTVMGLTANGAVIISTRDGKLRYPNRDAFLSDFMD